MRYVRDPLIVEVREDSDLISLSDTDTGESINLSLREARWLALTSLPAALHLLVRRLGRLT